METSGLPAVKPPMVKPVIVMTSADEGMTAPAVVMTTEVALVVLHVPVSPATLLLPAATVGVMDGAKKPEGYVSVKVPPGGTGTDGVKLSVATAVVFPALRSKAETLKELICSEEGKADTTADRPRINPKLRENAATENATMPIFHQVANQNRNKGMQTPQIMIAATSPCVS